MKPARDSLQNHFPKHHRQPSLRLSDQGGSGGALVTPGGGQDTDGLVVTGQTVDTGLDQNEAELGVLVLAVTLKVLADSNSLYTISGIDHSSDRHGVKYLLDQEVEVLGEFGSEACIPKSLCQSCSGPSRGLGAGAFLRPELCVCGE